MKRLSLLFVAGFVLFVNVGVVKGEFQMIEDGKKVKFNYTLTVKGEIADTSEGRGPLEYVHGQGKIIKGLESQLKGLKVGDEKTVVVSAEDGYGPVDPNAVVDLPKSNLAPDVAPEKGMVLQMQPKDGQVIPGTVEEVDEETLKANEALIEWIEALDDVDVVYHNMAMPS